MGGNDAKFNVISTISFGNVRFAFFFSLKHFSCSLTSFR
nr:MAG TPA: hypothetical protein [Caudoviricetes sp.]